MASETEPYARIQFAADLAGLGETRGFEMLEGYCSNAAEPIAARLRAARVLEVDLKRQSCAQVLVAALKDREPTYRMDALTLIPYARNLAATEFLQLDNLLLNSLFDENRSVRITAAHTAEKLGDASAISALQIALASESDRDVQEAMHSAVKSLQSQQP
jgi:HEAT repeat protein